MIKSFDFIEAELAEQILIEGEDILHEGQVSKRNSGIRNLFLFQVGNVNQLHEVEILISPKYIKNYSCDCETYKQDSICKHIAAGLLFIRRDKTDRLLKKQRKELKPTKFDIDGIFEHVSASEIKAFIKQYSKSNAKFATSFKVNFARKVPTTNYQEKYSSIINKLLKPITKANEKYTAPTINFFVKQAKELYEQYKDAKSLKYYVEAATLLHLLLKKTSYAINYSKLANESLDKLNDSIHSEISQLLSENLAPELRDQLIKNIYEIVSASYYRMTSLQSNVAYQIYKYGSKEEGQVLSKILLLKMDNHQFEGQELICSVALLLMISSKYGESIPDVYPILRTEHLHEIFNLLFKNEELKLIELFISQCELHSHLSSFAFDDVKLLLARRSEDSEKVSEFLTKKFFSSGNLSYVKEILAFDLDLAAESLKVIQSKIYGKSKFDDLNLEIYFKLEEYDLLIDAVNSNERYQEMDRYLEKIYRSDKSLVELYFRKYLENCVKDPFHSHRNHSMLMRNADLLRDPLVSTFYRNMLRDQRKQIELELFSEE